jgi:hypothetical protein
MSGLLGRLEWMARLGLPLTALAAVALAEAAGRRWF